MFVGWLQNVQATCEFISGTGERQTERKRERERDRDRDRDSERGRQTSGETKDRQNDVKEIKERSHLRNDMYT